MEKYTKLTQEQINQLDQHLPRKGKHTVANMCDMSHATVQAVFSLRFENQKVIAASLDLIEDKANTVLQFVDKCKLHGKS